MNAAYERYRKEGIANVIETRGVERAKKYLRENIGIGIAIGAVCTAGGTAFAGYGIALLVKYPKYSHLFVPQGEPGFPKGMAFFLMVEASILLSQILPIIGEVHRNYKDLKKLQRGEYTSKKSNGYPNSHIPT